MLTGATVTGITPAGGGQWSVATSSTSGDAEGTFALVVVCVGVRPVTDLAVAAGARLGQAGAIVVDEQMRTGVPHVWAAGDCVVTHHRLLGTTWLPLGTTAHKQGRVAGENMLGGSRSLPVPWGRRCEGVRPRRRPHRPLRHHETAPLDVSPLTRVTVADDHKRYYPGAVPLTISVTGDHASGQLLGAQIVGERSAEISKRSTRSPPPTTPASWWTTSSTWTSATRRRSGPRGMPCRSPRRAGNAPPRRRTRPG